MVHSEDHIIVLDEGTTSTRAVLYGHDSSILETTAESLDLESRSGGRVEQDAEEIYEKSVRVIREIASRARSQNRRIAALAIAPQRTSVALWDRLTGRAVAPVYSWQDTRSAPLVEELRAEGWAPRSTEHTGMVLSSASPFHLAWMLRDPELRRRAEAGELLAGTLDTWLIWRFTGGIEGGRHVTSSSCAGSSGMFDIDSESWWVSLLDRVDVPVGLLAEVLPEDGDFGTAIARFAGVDAPITGVIGDQQSALYGQGGVEAGAVKCTHGTGSFIDFNVGNEHVRQLDGLDCRIGWRTAGQAANVIEGGTFVSGSAIEWLTTGIGVLDRADVLDSTYDESDSTSGLIVVPALAGFAAPHWDQSARGTILGLHRGTTRADLVRGTLDGIAQTIADLLDAMAEGAGIRPTAIYVDGGLSRSRRLLQFQADLLGIPVVCAPNPEFVTALGAAHLAGIATGLWSSQAEAASGIEPALTVEPAMATTERDARRAAWQDAVQRSLGWREASYPAQA